MSHKNLAECMTFAQSYGFSDKIGLVAHGDDESVYLSGKKKDEIESEIKTYVKVDAAIIPLLTRGWSIGSWIRA